MTSEEGKRIYSNDYADLIVLSSYVEGSIKNFSDATIQRIDNAFTVIRVPIEYNTDNIIEQFNYIIVPTLYGLISQTTTEASGITKMRSIPKLNLRGKGTLIGIIDSGIDYTNPIFINADNTTKIVSIWDQTIYTEDYLSNTFYGTEYTRDQINQALQSDNPYDVVPSRDEIGHGTMLAGIAAGNEVLESNFYGIAPDAELVIVKLKPAKKYLKEFWQIPENAICYQLNDIEFGVNYLQKVSIELNQPVSICLALGTSQSFHDGKNFLSRALSAYAESFSFSVQIAAGNEGNAKRHYSGIVDPLIGYDKVELKVGENESGFTMELWGESPGLFSVDIITPTGEYVSKIIPRSNEHISVSFIFVPTTIQIDYQLVESQTGEELILMRFTKPVSGIWTLQVYDSSKLGLRFHIWLPMGEFISNDTYFLNSDPYTTILTPANSLNPITVTAYNHENNNLYQNASRGYTRNGYIKPDIAAPGVNIVSPNLKQGFSEVTGTSPAVAHVTGVAAILMEWGIVNGNMPIINTADIKTLMIKGGKRDPNIEYPNREWGYGILDVYNIFNRLRRGI